MKTAYDTVIRLSPVYVALVLFALAGYQHEAVIFDRQAIARGEVWRLFTAHFIHCDFEHLALNLLGIISLIVVFNRISVSGIWLSLLSGIVMVDAWIWYGMGDLSYYCGLSGVENSILVCGLYSFWKNENQTPAIVIGCLSMLKIGYEILNQNSLFSDLSWQSVPQAHAAGFAAGILFVAAEIRIRSSV